MKTVETTVNISLKYPATEKKLCAIIKSGKTEDKYLAHFFALFTDVPLPDLLAFAENNDLSLTAVKKFYQKYIKQFYPNPALEEALSGK